MSHPLALLSSFILHPSSSLLALLLTSGCGGGGNSAAPNQPPPTEVEIQSAATGTIEDIQPAVGTIEAWESVDLRAEAAGVIAAIHFAEGKQVAKDALLFELDSRKEQAALAQATAELDVAKQNLERARKLEGTRAISQQEIDQLASAVQARAAALRLQEERLSDMTLRAPFNGTVGTRKVSPGQYVDTGMHLLTLVDDSQVKVVYRVPERLLARFKLDQAVRLRAAAYPDRTFDGRIDLIHPSIDEATRTALIRAVLPNPDRALRAGMFARVETVLDRRAATLVIPESALVASLEGFTVFKNVNGTARLTPVQIGVRGRGTVEIRSGLAVGDPIVIEGTQKLVDGMPIVQSTSPSPAAAQEPKPATAPGH